MSSHAWHEHERTRHRWATGFGIHRTDKTENEAYWLEGTKALPDYRSRPPSGRQVPTNKHPIQSFLWGDFTAKPSHRYTYRVVAIRGTPEAPVEAEAIDLSVDTEDEGRDLHDIHFNRGAISSQAYTARFGERKPPEVGAEAYDWLSRGLKEAMIRFIAKASGGNYKLARLSTSSSFPQFSTRFHSAKMTGADIQIIYDAKFNSKGPKAKNEIRNQG